MKTRRNGIGKLVAHMTTEGFFSAPCSSKHHLACEGGLAEHSWNVYEYAHKIAKAVLSKEEYSELKNSITICSLLHDLGKMPRRGKPVYVENILKSGNRSEAEPYKTNKDLMYQEHEIMSVVIASKYIDLTEDEENAILHHNGLYGKLDSSFGSYYDKSNLGMILHFADMFCSRNDFENQKGDKND